MSRLVSFDLESTGLDVANDRIVSMAFQVEGGEMIYKLVNPGIPIPAEATAIHGISDADVVECPPFRRYARSVQDLVDGKVLVGYCCRTFDTVLLDAELRRAGQPGLSRGGDGRINQPEIDLYRLWLKKEERTLVGAARRFAGVELGDDAHSADADAEVLVKVLHGMIEEFILDGLEIDELCALCIPEGEVDRAGKFKRREDGVVVLAFGKHDGTPAAEVPEYLRWMLGKDFPEETLVYAREILEGSYRPRPKPQQLQARPTQEALF